MNKIISTVKQWRLRNKIVASVFLCLIIVFIFSLPSRLFNAPTSFVITDADGNLLNASIASDGQWRFPYNSQVPEKFIKCITAFEDKRFYYHPGIDPIAIVRAIRQNFLNRRTVSGGSTLTMQVIRMYKKHSHRSLLHKFQECLLAIRMECSYRKKTIMALYAANAPFGSNVVGLHAAAWRYYARPSIQLSWGEMAALAVLPNAPSLVHPGRNSLIFLRKRNELIDRLIAKKVIDIITGSLAKAEPLPGEPKALPQYAPHLLERFKKEYSRLKITEPDMLTSLKTTIDYNLQVTVNQIISAHHSELKGNQIKNAAAIVLENETGNVLAYVGNVYEPKDSSQGSYVDILSSARSPGSTLKPLLYSSLLTEGSMLPKQLIPDIPTQIGGYMPVNFELSYDGAVPADRALARSLNIPAVRMLQQFKYQRFYEVLKNSGFTTLNKPADNYGMSLILGGCEIIPYELAGAYSSMVRMYNHENKNHDQWNPNDWHRPNYIATPTHTSLTINESGQLFDYPSLYQTFNAMNEVMRPGEEGLWGLFGSAQKIAWKTGTSVSFRDGWAVGITAKYCVLVWIGNASGEGRPDLIGINTAAPAMFDIFRSLPASDWFQPPSIGVMNMQICKKSGFKAGVDCEETTNSIVSEHAKNVVTCPYCKKINLDQSGLYRVNESCISPSDMNRQAFFILPPTIEYYYKQKHPEYRSIPAYKPGCEFEAYHILDIIYPDEGSKMFIPKEMSGEKGKIVFNATHNDPEAKIFWHIDNSYVGTTQHFHQIGLAPVKGKHVITIIDINGNSQSRGFEIE